MSITYENTPLRWDSVGVEPSESLKTNGFQPGYRPAAQTFDFQINNSSACLTELQKKLSNLDDEVVKGIKGNGVEIAPDGDRIVSLTPENIGAAASSHNHSASNITSGTLLVSRGGTGQTSLTNGNILLGGGTGPIGSTATLPISKGGTGATTVDEARSSLNIVGKSMAGQSVTPTSGTTVTSGECAEVFNDYRTRTFDGNGDTTSGNIASGVYSFAEGQSTTASGDCSHSEGCRGTASGEHAHVEGYFTKATSAQAHAEGNQTTARGAHSHAEGFGTQAAGTCAHSAGMQTEAVGDCSQTGGKGTYANSYQFVHGKFNGVHDGPTSDGDLGGNVFIIGGGISTSDRRNALRTTTDGRTYGLQNISCGCSDYAEYFEWEDGNPDDEDRRGSFVTLNSNKIRKANASDEYILGIVSATPCIVGDVQSELWKYRFLTDAFGEKIVEYVNVEEKTDEFGKVIPAHTEKRWVENPNYDPTKKYVRREDRKEWAAIGLLGKLIVIDDGSCQSGGFCNVADGGTATQSNTGWKVLKRIDDTHIQILYR